MKNKKSKLLAPKLKNQLIISFVVIFCAIMLLCFFLTYNIVISILKKQSENYTLREFNQAEYNVQSLLDGVEKISTSIIADVSDTNLSLVSDKSISEKISSFNKFNSDVMNLIYNFNYIDSVCLQFSDGTELIISKSSSRILNSKQDGDLMKFLGINSLTYNRYGTKWYLTKSITNFYKPSIKNPSKENYITAARNIYVNTNKQYTIAINVNEKYFRSIYDNNFKNANDNNVFITNENGSIVSHKNSLNIGSNFEYIDKLKNSYGSFTQKINDMNMQVIYYKLNKTGWYLVNEIPVKLYDKDLKDFSTTITCVFLIGAFVAIALAIYWLYRITKPLEVLMYKMKKLGSGNFDTETDNSARNELGYIGNQFDVMSKNISELVQKNKDVEEQKRRYEINALQAQINPHFIFNTISTIKWMAVGSNANNMVDGLNALANILRPVFKNMSQMSTIEKELDCVENYIKIMNIRYGEGISLEVNIPEEIKKCSIPNFTLQPIVENSVTHGLDQFSHIGRIGISAQVNKKDIEICISDTGIGISEEKLMDLNRKFNSVDEFEKVKSGIGCSNIHHRIKLLYGDEYGLKIESYEKGGTMVYITIPMQVGEEE